MKILSDLYLSITVVLPFYILIYLLNKKSQTLFTWWYVINLKSREHSGLKNLIVWYFGWQQRQSTSLFIDWRLIKVYIYCLMFICIISFHYIHLSQVMQYKHLLKYCCVRYSFSWKENVIKSIHHTKIILQTSCSTIWKRHI